MNIAANFNRIITIFLLLLAGGSPLLPSARLCELRIMDPGGRAVLLHVEIADTEELRVKGLMNRRAMDPDRGMLFVFDRELNVSFWMKNTLIPLSIAYVRGDGVISEIYDMKPLDVSVRYPSARPARYAVEVNRGWFERKNIGPGCRIIFNGCLGK
ncbi:MAG: hypothetical protein A2176_11520 [Spirochaetes bacterium RBG_13_51_14]|nr:MAG: hypothetical protein A2176_11520 [Spirochaetes bacterium RBG_13_51_14]